MAEKLCNWDSRESYCYLILGRVLEDVNCTGIILVFFFLGFLGFWLSALMPILTSWYFNSYFPGVILAIAVNFIGDNSNFEYDMLRDVSYYNIYKGIDVKYQFIYPVLVILLILVAGWLKNKKDFIAKSVK